MKTLFDQNQIKQRVKELGQIITNDFIDKNLVVFGLAQGGLMFCMDLIRQINLDLEYHTLKISSYGNGRTSNQPKLVYFPQNIDLNNKNVLIIDDICDTGKTLEFLIKYLNEHYKINDIKTCVLVKNLSKKSDIPNQYVGFYSHGEWLIGYGLDDKGFSRNINKIMYKE